MFCASEIKFYFEISLFIFFFMFAFYKQIGKYLYTRAIYLNVLDLPPFFCSVTNYEITYISHLKQY